MGGEYRGECEGLLLPKRDPRVEGECRDEGSLKVLGKRASNDRAGMGDNSMVVLPVDVKEYFTCITQCQLALLFNDSAFSGRRGKTRNAPSSDTCTSHATVPVPPMRLIMQSRNSQYSPVPGSSLSASTPQPPPLIAGDAALACKDYIVSSASNPRCRGCWSRWDHTGSR